VFAADEMRQFGRHGFHPFCSRLPLFLLIAVAPFVAERPAPFNGQIRQSIV
jgi:hypothetical protein